MKIHEVSWGDHKDDDLGAMPSCKDDEKLFHRQKKMVVLAAHWLKGYRARTLKISHFEAKNAGWKMIFHVSFRGYMGTITATLSMCS